MTRRLVCGVYAIQGPNDAVYVGQSQNCWARDTFKIAVLLGLPCGVVREFSASCGINRRQRIEREVAAVFRRRGLTVVSTHGDQSLSARHSPVFVTAALP